MPSITADAGAFTLTGFPLPPKMFAGAGAFTLSGQSAGLGRALTIDFDLPESIRLQRLNIDLPFTGPNGNPTISAQRWWQEVVERLEAAYAALAESVTAIQNTYNAAAQASTAATEAQSSAAAAQTAAEEVTETVEQIQSGDLALARINVGGQNFVNNAGSLVAEP